MSDDLAQTIAHLAEIEEMVPGLVAELDRAEAEVLHEVPPGELQDALLSEIRDIRKGLTDD